MTALSSTGCLKIACCDDLVSILPQYASRILTASFVNRAADVLEKPSKVAPLGDKHARCRAKPAYTADLAFPVWSIVHLFRRAQMMVKPRQQSAHFLHLPECSKVDLVIPNVEGGAKHTAIAAGISVSRTGFKSDVHVSFLRISQTLLRRFMTESYCPERAMRFRSRFSLGSVQRKTCEAHTTMSDFAHYSAKNRSRKSAHRKRIVSIMETVS